MSGDCAGNGVGAAAAAHVAVLLQSPVKTFTFGRANATQIAFRAGAAGGFVAETGIDLGRLRRSGGASALTAAPSRSLAGFPGPRSSRLFLFHAGTVDQPIGSDRDVA
jgi:hypothetical protein